MKKMLVRHGQSGANRLTRIAFGAAGADLTERGIEQSSELGKVFDERGVDKTQTVAVSELVRTQQTASLCWVC